MTRTDIFLDLYKQLEQLGVEKFNLPANGTVVSRMEKMSRFADIKSELRYCREVRALLQHQPQVGDNFAVEPSEEMINLLRSVVKELDNKPHCKDICIGHGRMLVAHPKDKVLPVMQRMYELGISNVPIVNSANRILGVFNENTVFQYVLDRGTGVSDMSVKKLSEDTVFSDLSPYTSILRRGHTSFRFAKDDIFVSDAENIFYSSLKKGERIAVIFLTENGNKNEPIKGLVTPWDIIIP